MVKMMLLPNYVIGSIVIAVGLTTMFLSNEPDILPANVGSRRNAILKIVGIVLVVVGAIILLIPD